jgi:hypothetical protein
VISTNLPLWKAWALNGWTGVLMIDIGCPFEVENAASFSSSRPDPLPRALSRSMRNYIEHSTSIVFLYFIAGIDAVYGAPGQRRMSGVPPQRRTRCQSDSRRMRRCTTPAPTLPCSGAARLDASCAWRASPPSLLARHGP